MTLLEAVDSLSLLELNAVSFIHVAPFRSQHVAFFSVAFVLPFLTVELSAEYWSDEPKLWPDQARLLQSETPIQEQIRELQKTRTLGTLSPIYLRPTNHTPCASWIVETHSGTDLERLTWMEAIISLEGRTPWRKPLEQVRVARGLHPE